MASSLSPDVAVADRGVAGRGLVAARDLPAGHVVLVDLPALVIAAPDAAHAVCSSCLRRLDVAAAAAEDPRRGHHHDLLSCPGCSQSSSSASLLPVRFCSPECAAARAGAPGFHTPALCRALQTADYRGLPDADAASSLRFVLTVAALRAEAEAESGGGQGGGGPPDSSSRAASRAAAAALGALSSMAAPATAVARLGAQELALRSHGALEGAGIRPLTPEEVGHWLAVEEANGFAALAASSPSSSSSPPSSNGGAPAPAAAVAASPPLPQVRGTCFYPRAFLFNHDCLPSVARFDDFDGRGHGAALEAAISSSVAAAGGGDAAEFFSREQATTTTTAPAAQWRTALVAVTLHPLPRGEELCLSYVPLSWGRAERAGRLAACYGFGCRCARCLGELEAFGGCGSGGEGGGGGGGGIALSSPLDDETAAAISGAASWGRPPFSTEEAARGALASALRLATEAARDPRTAAPGGGGGGASSSSSSATTPPPAEIGYIRAFLAKFSCPAPLRKGGGGGGGGGVGDGGGDCEEDSDDDEECGGTLVPVGAAPAPAPTHYQCNSCGFVRSEEDFLRSLAALDDDDDDDEDDDEEMEDD